MNYLNLYKNNLVKVYYDEDLATSESGYLLLEDEQHILLHKISENGQRNGYGLIDKQVIHSISNKADYLEKVAILEKEIQKNHYHSEIYKQIEFDIPTENLRANIFNLVIEKNIICNAELFDPDFTFTGFVKSVFEDKILMSYFDEEVLLNLDEITHFYFDRINEKQRYFIDKILKHS